MDKISEEIIEEPQRILPVLPLRDVVVYPNMVIPLFVGRDMSISALEKALAEDNRQILLVAQKNAQDNEPKVDDLYQMGTISNVLQLLKLPDGTIKLLVEGEQRAKIINFLNINEGFAANVIPLSVKINEDKEIEVLSRSITSQFDQYLKLNKKVPPEILNSLSGIDDPSRLADTIAAQIAVKQDEKQKILEIVEVQKRLEHLIGLMESEIDLLKVEKRIRKRVKDQMEKSQREHYLNERA